jgi:glycosyltransferase involved in cell wall biosynthesis
MKTITFIYAYEKEEWSTPLALANEFKSRGWDVKFVSIGSNSRGDYNATELRPWIQQGIESDITLFMDWGRFDSSYLDKRLKPNSFWIQESGDDPQNFERNYPKAFKFDMVVTPDHDSYLEYKKRGINAYWQTHFADTRVQFPITVHKSEYTAVTTRGKGGSQFLDTITEHGQGAIGNKNRMDSVEHTKFLNSGLMVVQNSRHGEITRRIFEGMACGKMVLTDKLTDSKKLQELFKDKKEIVFYDDIVDCIEKINYYAEHDSARELIAINGYQNVVKNHTERNRVDFMIKKYEEWKKN